jgi:predicted helicase
MRPESSKKAAFAEYCKKLTHALKAGNATEHTHRPALKALIESLATDVTATNEPQKIECGSPDYIVTRRGTPLGYIEAKDVGADLDRAEATDQLQRYRSSLRNLILTDYLAFRLYRNSELIQTARLARWHKSETLRPEPGGADETEKLLGTFFEAVVPTISTPRELAERMARLARLLRDLIREVFAHEGKKGDLHGQYDAFKKVLIADLSVDQFADMYAQTIAYGLFAARCNHAGPGFTRAHAGKELPKTNPFLRRLFNTIAGADLDDRIAWAVDDLAELLARADMKAILADFGKATRREDPVVHFYETFLAAYDPKLRETRGVYYTPEPVVGYIVRSIDLILQKRFHLKDGLADKSKVNIQLPAASGKKKTKLFETHRVQILDPACGTGTFLHAVIAQVQERFLGAQGLWPGYVATHLLPRLYGFELLMAPYAVAHMKLGLQLHESGYDFAADERLRVFLTNSVEEAHEHAGLPLFAQWLADEAAAASEVKRDVPIMVVLGNPPYAGISANRGDWIENLVSEYKKEPDGAPLQERKHWLRDDYVKFIRFGQWRIEQTGYGVLGFISNHGYLDNPTFRGMRHSLMQTFDHIYVLDLHGNSNKKEQAPDGSKDVNVFDIQLGVAICLMVRTGTKAPPSKTIHHAELWGTREAKYEALASQDVATTKWSRLKPELPNLFFYPRSTDFSEEYQLYPSIKDSVHVMGLGFQSSRDDVVVGFSKKEIVKRIEAFLDPVVPDDVIRERFFPGKKVADYAAGDTRQWSLTAARAARLSFGDHSCDNERPQFHVRAVSRF